MKKIICLLICLVMVLALMGCSHLPEDAKGIAENAVIVTEQYLQGDINVEDASLKLKYYEEQANAIMPDLEDHDETHAMFAMQTYVHLLYVNISTHDPEEKIREHLKELKKLL